jgi:hypothetical protein
MKRLLPTCLLAATSFAACSSSDPATEADYDDVAQALTAVVVTDNGGGEVGAMVDAASIAHGDGKLTLNVDAAGKFTGSHLGLNYAYTASCSDAEGTEQEACGKTSDTADIAVSYSGELALPRISAAVTREGSWSLTGLQSDEVTIVGESDFNLDAELESLFRTAKRTYKVSYSASYDAVVLNRSARAVKGGSIAYSIDAERTASGPRRESEAKFTMDGTLEFHTDGSASLTLDRDYKYNVDLVTGELSKDKS